jgi:formyltetrahydrofolate deformylase
MGADVNAAGDAYIFTFKCEDRLGLLARSSGLMYDFGAFVTEVAHFGDNETRLYASRIVFDDRSLKTSLTDFRQAIGELAQTSGMQWSLRPASYRPRVLIAVSREDHCLNVLLTRWRSGVLPVDIVGVLSNHEVCRPLVEFYGIPYHYLPVTNANRSGQEADIMALISEQQVDLLVLARYMQILSDEMCAAMAGKAINIHHSFLPSFKGARPYHQAHKRGVKVIGATAHYVTPNLDEGPIIVQEVQAVNHTHTVADMVNMGHDIEATALSRAVLLHVQDRVVVDGERTIIL